MLGLPLYGYVSKSSKTTLQDSVVAPGNGFARGELKERGAPMCAFTSKPPTQIARPLGPTRGANRRPTKIMNLTADTAGDLSSYYGQEIAFNQIVALGALEKSGSVYVQANGYTEGTCSFPLMPM